MNIDKSRWQRVKFGDVVRLNTDRCADPAATGTERYVGLEYIDPEDLRLRRWGLIEEGTTFTNYFRPGQVLFGKRRAYQRKIAMTVARLASCGMTSAYHQHHRCRHGHERHATWYNHKRAGHGYHIDYCFVPQAWTPKLGSVRVGRLDEWQAFSDHCPLIPTLAVDDPWTNAPCATHQASVRAVA